MHFGIHEGFIADRALGRAEHTGRNGQCDRRNLWRRHRRRKPAFWRHHSGLGWDCHRARRRRRRGHRRRMERTRQGDCDFGGRRDRDGRLVRRRGHRRGQQRPGCQRLRRAEDRDDFRRHRDRRRRQHRRRGHRLRLVRPQRHEGDDYRRNGLCDRRQPGFAQLRQQRHRDRRTPSGHARDPLSAHDKRRVRPCDAADGVA